MPCDTEKLLRICHAHNSDQQNVVVTEPYIPFLPKPSLEWNGILVVAVAQNLSDAGREYRSWLESACQQDRVDRLNVCYSLHGKIGVGPWDDGTIKLAVAAIRGVDAVARVAVSNAVLWSGRDSGSNEALSREVITASISAWRDMLEVLAPAEVLAFGATARDAMRQCDFPRDRVIGLPGPFSRNYSISFKMDIGRLLAAFPEVAQARDSLLGSVNFRDESLAIHCACAAVSAEMKRKRESG